ncbi:hypothetical protein BJ322DRAFT_1109249 [Thelephora terrestris]|uniref:Glutaminase n=1 Tax=Thelephora terrestris TaxID=56493 RepID=A0A9P6HEI4_9AGAM|nr:hypothetical protein BJ322DRAFT_1109249 [Thelephora terrestris]
MLLPSSCLQLLFVASSALAQNWTANPFIPPALPLAVKTPYLQTWVQRAGVNSSLNYGWQSYRDGSKIAWVGFLRVDIDQFFVWMGDPLGKNAAVQKDMTLTPTRTIITMTCGSVDLTATFLNPIEADLVNQSIPFSYLAVEVASNDGDPHKEQLYTEIDGEWLAQSDQLIQWETTTGDTVTHQYWLQNQTEFGEVNGRLRYGSVFHSTKQVSGVTYQVAYADSGPWPAFQSSGILNNTVDNSFRAIQDSWPVFGFAHDLGTVVTAKTAPTVYAVGYVRDPLVQLSNIPNVNRLRSPYYLTRYSSIPDMVTTFLDDYPNALARAVNFDNKLASDSLAITPQDSDYANILALSVRQTFANIKLTSHCQVDGFVNAVDKIYSAWPAFLYTNPAVGGYLLEPLLAYQAANPIQGGYAIHDIGDSMYPNVTVSSNEAYPVEACGHQLIMALSYTQKSSDDSLITKYQSLCGQFGTYLAENCLYMSSQASPPPFWEQWQNVALSSDKSHYTLSYKDDPSWTLLYNLYADRLLGFNMFPPSVHNTQTKWYATKLDQFGIRLDSRSSDAKTDWQLWTAATVTNLSARTTMISLVEKYVSSRINIGPFPDRYNSENGQAAAFLDRTVVGGHFTLLLVPDVLQGGTNGSGGNNGGNNGGAATGGLPGLPVAFALFVTLIYTLS